MIHGQKRIYACEICEKSFKTESYLKTHKSALHELIKSRDNVKEYYSHVSQDSEMNTSDSKENDYVWKNSTFNQL